MAVPLPSAFISTCSPPSPYEGVQSYGAEDLFFGGGHP